MRRVLFALCLLLTVLCADARALTAGGKVIVCDVDTGINPAHQEFASDQLVGFFDFSDGTAPAAGQLWDADTTPFDPDGHGTATASMIGALGISSEQSKAGFPGVKLAMAKVADADGSITGDLGAAIRWCVDTVHADTINMSIGVIAPVGPGQAIFQDTYDAMHETRAHGILFTSSNGNGIGNTGQVPGDGATTPYGSSLDTLSVGAAGTRGVQVAYNPEVAAIYAVRTPTKDGRNTYRDISGTSFASPFTNGFGARLIAEALAAGKAPPVADVEQTIKNVALDTDLPPIFEGYGVIDSSRLPDAITAIRSGTVPARDDQSSLYVEEVAGGLRKLSAGYLPTDTYDDPGAGAPVGGARQPAAAATPTATPDVAGGATPTPTPEAGTPAPGATVQPAPTVPVDAGPVAPTLGTLKILRKPRLRVRLLLDQRVTLTLVVTRHGAQVSRRVMRYRGPGAVTLPLGRLRRGSYRLRVRATSELGAGSVTARTRLRVR